MSAPHRALILFCVLQNIISFNFQPHKAMSKPKTPQEITATVARTFPNLEGTFREAGVDPATAFVWHRAQMGNGEAILVINGTMYEGEGSGELGEGSNIAVRNALEKYISAPM